MLIQPRYQGQKDTRMIGKIHGDGEKSLLLHHFLHQPQVHMLTTTLHHRNIHVTNEISSISSSLSCLATFSSLRLLKKNMLGLSEHLWRREQVNVIYAFLGLCESSQSFL